MYESYYHSPPLRSYPTPIVAEGNQQNYRITNFNCILWVTFLPSFLVVQVQLLLCGEMTPYKFPYPDHQLRLVAFHHFWDWATTSTNQLRIVCENVKHWIYNIATVCSWFCHFPTTFVTYKKRIKFLLYFVTKTIKHTMIFLFSSLQQLQHRSHKTMT